MTTSSIAQDWYEVIPVGVGIHLIRERYVAKWLRCNMWHIHGENRDLLIDSGMGLRSLKQEVSLLTEKPVDCISTHCHFDHIGGANEFGSRLGHHSEAEIHAFPTERNTAGYADFVRAETFSALPYEGFEFSQYSVKPAPLTGYLDEGDVIDLGNRHFVVFHLPGHSPGSIVLYEKATGTIFSGDVVYDGALLDTLYHSDRETYQASLRRLKELPIKVVHGGHYDSFGKERLYHIIDRYLSGEGRVENAAAWVEQQLS